MSNAWLPLLALMSSFVTSVAIFFTPEHCSRIRGAINLLGATFKLCLAVWLVLGVASGEVYTWRMDILAGVELVLRVDALCLLFLSLSAFLWLLTTIYAMGYLHGTSDQSRFFGFFSLCVAATTGVALAGTLLTFFIFYELLTLATWPLIVHRGDAASLAAGRKYLAYTLAGSALLLVGIIWLETLAGPVQFAVRGSLEGVEVRDLKFIFLVLIAGLGVKAALVPLHGWLPAAMVAPAPVSALLHAVAVVKAGAFGIVRVVYDVFGFELVHGLGLGVALAVLASLTIIYGSMRALVQVDLKRRLAYSTVSQVSYIVLGAALVGPASTVGGLVHLVHQGLMKITLFFCAGALAERMQVTRIDQLDGVGRAMPLTMGAFTVGALGLIGLPPLAGFVSKWQLGIGGLEAGQTWVIFVLAASSLMNAAYFLPPLYRAWFLPARAGTAPGRERPVLLIWPAVITAITVIGAGLFAGAALSPLNWARLIIEREYTP